MVATARVALVEAAAAGVELGASIELTSMLIGGGESGIVSSEPSSDTCAFPDLSC